MTHTRNNKAPESHSKQPVKMTEISHNDPHRPRLSHAASSFRSGMVILGVGVSAFISSARAEVISFDAVGALTGGMTATDTAGAPEVSVANWNNMNSLQTLAGGSISGSLAAGSITNSAGIVMPSMTLSWTGTGVANAAGTGVDSQKMFESEWDLFDSANNTTVADMSFTLTNIPFTLYDVYFYVQDASNVSTTRGGDVTANGFTESIRMFATPTDIPGGPFSYVEADNAFTFNSTNTTQGTFLRIKDVTGETLTLTVSSKNASPSRLRMSGFQVVEAIPEPGSALCLTIGAGALLGMRRRRCVA
jgi:hypothetical protein